MMMKLSVILMMVVAGIFAASQSKSSDLMFRIHEETKDLLSNLSKPKLNETKLPVASKPGNICWAGFFCRAEICLRKVDMPELKKLEHFIEQYNQENKNHSVPCNLTSNTSDSLQKFLEEVKECTEVFKKSRQGVQTKKHTKA